MSDTQPKIKQDLLLQKINKIFIQQKNQASIHKYMYRFLWAASALVSLLIAIFSVFDWSVEGVNSKDVATFLSLILPLITGYIVIRTPEKLWIYEVDMRNQLADLTTEIELQMDRDENFDREPYEKRFLAIMASANKKWLALKHKAD